MKPVFIIKRWLIFALLLAACALPVYAASNAAVVYKVAIPDPAKHIFHISMEMKNPSSLSFDVKMPVWMQAVYELQTYGEQVQGIKAHNEQNEAVELAAINDHTWRVKLSKLAPLIIEYDLDVSDKHKLFGKSYLEKQTALLHGGSSLLYVQAERRKPVSITIQLPASWSAATALDKAFDTNSGETTTASVVAYAARDYDELTDSPIMLGAFKRVDFTAAGVPFSIAIDTRIKHSSAELIESAQRIAAQEINFFGSAPFDHYLFIYYSTKDTTGAGLPSPMVGIEHLKSTLITVDPGFDNVPRISTFAYREVTAHELFHAWNVKAIRPAALDYPDFDHAPVVRSLWLLEGFTEYYAQKFLAQLFGDDKHEQFYKQLGEDLTAAELPVSLQQLSLQAPTEAIEQFALLYYKGTVAGLLLDLKMRQLTGNKRGLDDFMRTLWTRYGHTRVAYDENELPKIINETAQNDLSGFYRNYIVGISPLPLEDYLQIGGWTIKGQKIKSPFVDFALMKGIVTEIALGGNAELSGIKLQDKVIAVDGTPLDEQNTFGKLIAKRGAGAKHTFTIERAGKREEIPFKYEAMLIRQPTFAELPNATPDQLATRRAVLSFTNANASAGAPISGSSN